MFEHIKIAKNTLYQIIARIVSSGTSFIISVIIARHFGIMGYGDFAKVSAVVTLFYLLSDFGFNAMFLQHEDSKIHFRDLFYLRFGISLLLILLVNILAFFLPYNRITGIGFSPDVRIGILMLSLTLLTEGILYSSSAIFQRELKYNFFMISAITGAVMSLLVTAGVIILSLPLLYIFVGFVLGAVVESGTALFLTRETLFPVWIDRLFIKRLFQDTLPLTLMLVFNAIYFRVDMIILATIKSSTDVAIYDIAYKFFDFLVALPLFLSNALYPALLEHQKNNRITSQSIRKLAFVFFLLAIPVVVFIWIFAPFIRLIKIEFLPAMWPLRILSLSLPIFFVTSILQWILITKKQQKILAYIYFLSTIVNVILNLILIPRYSYLASATITGLSEAGVLIMLWFIVLKHT